MDANILIAGIPAVGLVMALCQIAKTYVSAKWIPLVALVLGIGLVALAQKGISIEIVMMGLAVGLSASGAYSGTKAIVKKTK